jgi:hypothetical protein
LNSAQTRFPGCILSIGVMYQDREDKP